jgi:hypothetical protein
MPIGISSRSALVVTRNGTPHVPRDVSNTIRGAVRVGVRTSVDPSGYVVYDSTFQCDERRARRQIDTR